MPRRDADRNLLFGVLALQLEFVTRDALIAAMNDWVLDKARPLGRILVDRGALLAGRGELLESLVREHLAQHGDDPGASLAALPASDEVAEALRSIADPDSEGTVTHVASGTKADPNATGGFTPGGSPSRGGRFRKLRDHARGNLGVVFVAHDEELNREVALKEIRRGSADDPASQARFVVEAEVTGGLEHPGIVPVYSLGRYDDGQPFYAMRLIKGESLKDAIAEFHVAGVALEAGVRSLSLQKLLRRFLDVCNAIDYAHSRGVLHRDLKPANIMVGRYGETLVVDWGLAKAIGRSSDDGRPPEATLRPSSASGSAGTVAGSIVGTPAYMSPEQADGRLDLLGPASDIYSLGATLYAILTGRPPFVDGVVGEVLQRVRRGDFPRPREISPWLSPALEAVCLKAMATRPEDRYASAQALSEDVQRWMADEPVSAWREPWAVRARRAARRHRTSVTAVTAASLVALLLGGSGAAMLASRRATAERRLDLARAGVESRLAHARAHPESGAWSEARVAADGLSALIEAAPVGVRAASEARRLRTETLAEADQAGRDQALVADIVAARAARAELGAAGAVAALATAFRTYGVDPASPGRDLAIRLAGRPESVRIAVAAGLDEWARLERGLARGTEAWRAPAELAAAIDPDPARAEVRHAWVVNDSAALKRMAEPARLDRLQPAGLVLLASALGEGERGIAVLRRGLLRHPRDPWLNFELATGLEHLGPAGRDEAVTWYTAARALLPATGHSLADLLETKGRGDEAESIFLELSGLDKEPLARARDLNCFARVLRGRGKLAESRAMAARAEVACREVIRLRPRDAWAHSHLGLALIAGARPEEAVAAFREAIRLEPDEPSIHTNLGLALGASGDFKGAVAAYREALRIRPRFTEALTNLGGALQQSGDLKGAADVYREAIRLQPDNAWAHSNLSGAMRGLGDPKGGAEAAREAVRLAPDDQISHHSLGLCLRDAGDFPGAIVALREAVRLRPDLLWPRIDLGIALDLSGDGKGAVEAFRQAARIKPDSPEAQYNLGMLLGRSGDREGAVAAYRIATKFAPDYADAHCNLGHTLRELGQFREGLAELERGHALGAKQPGWPYPSAAWVEHARHLAELEAKLPAVLKNPRSATGPGERVELAGVAVAKEQYAAAAWILEAAFAETPSLAADLATARRYNAACWAARAAAGQGRDIPPPDPATRARLRGLALVWLDADLAAWGKRLETPSPQVRETILKTLAHWKTDPDLAGVRDEANLSKLPESERVAARRLWAEVESLSKKAGSN